MMCVAMCRCLRGAALSAVGCMQCSATHRRLVRLDHHVELEAVVLALEQRLLVLVLPAPHRIAPHWKRLCVGSPTTCQRAIQQHVCSGALYRTALLHHKPRSGQARGMQHVCTVALPPAPPARTADSTQPQPCVNNGTILNRAADRGTADKRRERTARHGTAAQRAASQSVGIAPAGRLVPTGTAHNAQCAVHETQSRELPRYSPQGVLI